MAGLCIALALCLGLYVASAANVNCNQNCAGNYAICSSACMANTNNMCSTLTCDPATLMCMASGTSCMSLRGDPELKGIDGRKFFFDGIAGKIFNLVSQKEHQINGLFVAGPHRIATHGNISEAHNGTYVGALGLKFHETSVEINVDEDGAITASYNGVVITADPENDYITNFSDGLVNVTYEEYRSGVGQAVTIKDSLFDLVVFATRKEFNEAEQQITRGHLNMVLKVNEDEYHMTDVHGVLGQVSPDSAPDNSLLAPELQTAFLGDGEDTDYIVSDLFADDFKYNRFGQPTRPIAAGTVEARSKTDLTASRRRLAGISSGWITMASL